MIVVQIMNWDKYNPRKDVKNSSWVRFHHDFFDNQEFYGFSKFERLFWIYLLCQASKKNQSTVPVVLEYVYDRVYHDGVRDGVRDAHHARVIFENEVHQALQKLQSFGMIKNRTSRGRYADVRGRIATDVTNETNGRKNVLTDGKSHGDSPADFEDFSGCLIDDEPDPPPPPPVEEKTSKLVALYVDCYLERAGHKVRVGAKEGGILKQLVKSYGYPAVQKAVEAFFQVPDAELVEKGWPIGLLAPKWNIVQRFIETGKFVTRAQAREADKDLAFDQKHAESRIEADKKIRAALGANKQLPGKE